MLNEQLPFYLHCFTNLKRDAKNGGAPHKPVLLLSIMQLFEEQIYTDHQIYILPELVAAFKSIWSKLVVTNHHPIFALPFYHMNSEPFWTLIAKVGCEQWIASKSPMRSLNNLNAAVNFAMIDPNLAAVLSDPAGRAVLKNAVLEQYFPETKMNLKEFSSDGLPSPSILNEPGEEYLRKILELKKQVDENTFQEEVFVRSGLFKREIPKIYNNTCAVSGMRIDALTAVSMIDACHIVPFSEGYNDTLTNGIALCPNIHRAFDRGLISVSDHYTVLLSKNFIENPSAYNLSQFEGNNIRLPSDNMHHPTLENLSHHRRRFGF